MNQTEVLSFLTSLGLRKIRPQSNGWVQASCPFSRWSHAKLRDEHPSFAVSIHEGGRSWCKCLACGFSGDPASVVRALESRSVNVNGNAVALAKTANTPAASQTISRLKKATQSTRLEIQSEDPSVMMELGGIQVSKGLYWGDHKDLQPPWPDSAIHHLLDIPPEAMAYLTGPDRNLDRKSILEWELGFHQPWGYITIPIRDHLRRLMNVSGRACLGMQRPKYRHGPHNSLYLYGEHRVVKGRRGILLEGNFDVIYMTQCGYNNVVGLMGTEASPIRLEKIKQWFTELYVALDPDKAGDKAAVKILTDLKNVLPVKQFHLPEGKDIDQLSIAHLRHIFGSPNI